MYLNVTKQELKEIRKLSRGPNPGEAMSAIFKYLGLDMSKVPWTDYEFREVPVVTQRFEPHPDAN